MVFFVGVNFLLGVGLFKCNWVLWMEKKLLIFIFLEIYLDIWFGFSYINNNKKVYVVIVLLEILEVVW